MKKIKLLFCFSVLSFSFSFSYGQSWQWGTKNSGNGLLYDAAPVATDKNGNAYVTGSNTNGNYTFNNGIFLSTYLTKYNSAGTSIWTRQITDSTGGESWGNAVATDISGNIYISGAFQRNAKAGVFLLHDTNGTDTYLIKYNSNGTVLWAKQSVSTSAGSTLVATDKYGNVFICGDFYGNTSFGSFTLNNRGIFTVKYDSNGNVLWAKQSNTPAGPLGGGVNSVTTDNIGNVYLAGSFYDTISFGSTMLTNIYSGNPSSSFIAKYSPAGNLLWAKQTVNPSIYGYCTTNAIITDKENNIYFTGTISDSVEFGSTILYVNNSFLYSAFLAKYDTGGNVIWVEQSSPNWFGTGLSSDAHNHIYMAGQTYWVMNFDTLTFGGYTLYTAPSLTYASFLLEFDTSGKAICGSMLNNIGGGWDSVAYIASDSTGTYVYLSSALARTVISGSDTLVDTTGSYTSSFLGRWQNCGADAGIPKTTSENTNVILYPNPTNGKFTIQSSVASSQSSVEVYNMLGEKVYNQLTMDNGQWTMDNSQLTINLNNQPSGIYLYRVTAKSGELIGEGKLIIQK